MGVSRLYLTDRDRYRVRTLDARVVLCIWRDDLLLFETGRGGERRFIDSARIAAVSSLAHIGRATIRWVPYDDCYRAIHQRRAVSRWRHPYAPQPESHAA